MIAASILPERHAVGRTVRFIAVADEPITSDAAKREQTGLGFHPAGYGFWEFVVVAVMLPGYGTRWVAEWTCSNTSD